MKGKTICIIGALKEEIAGIKRQMVVEDSIRLGPAHAFFGPWQKHRVALVRSGIGKQRARDALSQVCDRFPVSLVISIGYAGGIHPALLAGDLVVADTILENNPRTSTADPHPAQTSSPDGSLVERAMKLSLGIKMYRGGLLTVDEPVCKPEDKWALAKRYSVVAVDMETSGLLQCAKEKGLPFLSVRSITDTANEELVNFSSCINEYGEVSRIKAGWHILTHPGTIPKIRELRVNSQKAAQNLTRFVEEFLQLG